MSEGLPNPADRRWCMLADMNDLELQVHAGNVAYQLWSRMPEPKLNYTEWYYGTREQSLSDALEGVTTLNDNY